jgi:hypothetical protein
MLEPITISVPNLAARWNQTPADILTHATELRLQLLFNFDGLAFDLAEDWLRGGQDTIQRRERQSLTDFVERVEAKFKRRRNGQLSEWESLDHDEAVALRAEVTTAERQIKALKELLEERDRKRQKQHYRGALMAAPATVQELLRLGFTKHPHLAFRPEGLFCLREIDGVRVLDGPSVWLESAGSKWKECLEPADMVVSMAAVKAIEAAAKPQQTAPATDTATPAPVVAESAHVTPEKQVNAMKKSALITALEHEWPLIETDISEASRNGLKSAAHTGKHGVWDADKARAWAVSNGKIKQAAPLHSLSAFWSSLEQRGETP